MALQTWDTAYAENCEKLIQCPILVVSVVGQVETAFIESKTKLAAKQLGILAKVQQYFTPEQLFNLY